MNKLYKWCLLSCMAATLSSCNDFLTEENPSGLTADTFYKTESGAEALINSCYTPLRFWYGQEYATSMTELGTDIFTRGNGCAEAELSDYNSSLQGSSNAITKEWERLYSALNTCNTALNRLPSSELSASVKDIRMGGSLFLAGSLSMAYCRDMGRCLFNDRRMYRAVRLRLPFVRKGFLYSDYSRFKRGGG